jgi:hypothetical protein
MPPRTPELYDPTTSRPTEEAVRLAQQAREAWKPGDALLAPEVTDVLFGQEDLNFVTDGK